MMKSEYDRSYQWNPPGGNYYSQHLKGKHNVSEPLMTHKRRVKLTEDNVIIGEPLPSQSNENVNEDPFFVLGDKNKKFHPSVPYRNMKAWDKVKTGDKYNNRDEKLMNKNAEKRRDKMKNDQHRGEQRKTSNLINESVQTDYHLTNGKSNLRGEKSTQISLNVPESLENPIKIPKEKPIVKDFVLNLVRPGEKSEYQTKFAWTEPHSREPRSFEKGSENRSKMDTQLKIYSNFMSEYQRQFRPYEFVSENRYKRMKPGFNQSFEESHIQVMPDRPELRRRAVTPPPRPLKFKENVSPPPTRPTKFREDTSPPRPTKFRGEASSPPPSKHQRNSTPPQDTMNPQRFSFPHGRQKRFVTEYSANFDNKWKKLEAEIQKNLEEDEARKSMQQSRWYKEILELRKKAQEYRQRARGTHFSREHLGEIFTKSRRRDLDEYEDNNSMTQPRRQNRRKGNSPEHHWDQKLRDHSRNKTSSRMSRDMRNHGDISGDMRSHRHDRNRRSSSAEGTILTPISVCSSDGSTVIDKMSRSNSKSPEPRYYNWQHHTAGKPSFDNNLLLDEQASHDTEVKNEFLSKTYPLRLSHPNYYEPPSKSINPNPERKYTFQRYFNDSSPGECRNMKTIDYDSISRNSSVGKMSSIISSSSRSLALETLERAKRNRDEVLRSKS